MNKRGRGSFYEEVCVEYLIKNGFDILHRNYRCKLGEIDIIAKKDDIIRFIEVKFRGSGSYGSALAGVLVIVAGLLAIFSFGIAFALVGGKLFIRGIIAITASLSGASLISGAGLFSIGISILAILAVFCFCKWIVLVLAHFIQNMSRKRSVK